MLVTYIVHDRAGVKGNDVTITLSVTENSAAYVWGTVTTTIYDASGTTAQATDFTVTTGVGGRAEYSASLQITGAVAISTF